jgi:hypothetical protein
MHRVASDCVPRAVTSWDMTPSRVKAGDASLSGDDDRIPGDVARGRCSSSSFSQGMEDSVGLGLLEMAAWRGVATSSAALVVVVLAGPSLIASVGAARITYGWAGISQPWSALSACLVVCLSRLSAGLV